MQESRLFARLWVGRRCQEAHYEGGNRGLIVFCVHTEPGCFHALKVDTPRITGMDRFSVVDVAQVDYDR